MNKSILGLIFLLMSAALAGCKDDGSSHSGLVGVVDVQKVSNAMGWTDEMRIKAEHAQSKAQAQLEAYVKPLRRAYEEKRDQIAKAHKLTSDQTAAIDKARKTGDLEKLGLSKGEIEELMDLLLTWSGETASANAQLSQAIQAHQQAMAGAILQAVGPSIRRVAAANNRGVIVTPGGNLLYNDTASNLTDKVVDDLQHSSSAKIDLPDMRELKFTPRMSETRPGQ